MLLRRSLPVLALSGSLLLAACGSDEPSSGAESEAQATPAQAVAEIGKVRTALDDALASLRDGDRAAARETLSEGYVEHFEKVEGPLEKVDHELNEKLEESIAKDLRDKVADGASHAEARRLVVSIKADLETAERKLK